MDMTGTPCLHAPLSPAIQRCCDARNRIFQDVAADKMRALGPIEPDVDRERLMADVLARVGKDYLVQKGAAAAYRFAMPDPSTRQGIKDYIACVLHGMTVDAVSKRDGAALLSGARIALASLKHTPAPGVQKAKTFSQPQNEEQPAE